MRQLQRSDIDKLSKQGVLFVCASCPKMWRGMAEGRDACTGESCGSLMGRKDFPEYEGEIKDFSKLCFVCGEEDVLAFAQLEGSQRRFGVCKDHLEMVDDYVPKKLPTNGVIIEDRKIFVYPDPNKALSQFKTARHTS